MKSISCSGDPRKRSYSALADPGTRSMTRSGVTHEREGEAVGVVAGLREVGVKRHRFGAHRRHPGGEHRRSRPGSPGLREMKKTHPRCNQRRHALLRSPRRRLTVSRAQQTPHRQSREQAGPIPAIRRPRPRLATYRATSIPIAWRAHPRRARPRTHNTTSGAWLGHPGGAIATIAGGTP